MKMKRIGILVAVAAVFAVMTSGSASALTYTWQQVDWSQLYSSSGASWYDNSEGTPTVTGGSNLYWQNTFANEYYGSSYYPTIEAIRDDGQDDCYYARPYALAYHYAWCPDGGDDSGPICAEYSSGSNYITVYHHWGTSQGGENVNVDVRHYYNV